MVAKTSTRGPSIRGQAPVSGTGDYGIVPVDNHESQLATMMDSVLISVCGRTCSISAHDARSLVDLQSALQRALQMEGQSFHFFDVNGGSLTTDQQVQEAIAQGMTPLCASLTDASIHYIENRREELAQMQWKLIRDHMTGATGKIVGLSREVEEMRHQFDSHKKEVQSHTERLRMELIKAVDNERDIAQTELRQLSERVNAIAQLVNSERNKREIANQSADKQVQGVRDMIDSERSTRRQELAVQMAVVQDMKQAIEGEKCAREAFEDRHAFDLHTVNERIDTVGSHAAEMLQDQSLGFKKAVEEQSTEIQQFTRQCLRIRSEHETSISEANARFAEIEDRCASLEARVAEAASRQAAGLDRLAERHERISQALEHIRLEEKTREGQVQTAVDKVKEMENLLHQSEADTRELCMKERQLRDDQLRRTQQSLLSEHSRQITDLEKKLAERLERESVEREKNVQQILNEVGKTFDKMPASDAIEKVKEAAARKPEPPMDQGGSVTAATMPAAQQAHVIHVGTAAQHMPQQLQGQPVQSAAITSRGGSFAQSLPLAAVTPTGTPNQRTPQASRGGSAAVSAAGGSFSFSAGVQRTSATPVRQGSLIVQSPGSYGR
eukprot:gnl/TRDRNA2_/TRDRNA2_59033_c0_seq1.p1 gnl/TRDRNA2_/TRDRNA2_59033_c0~~gnl/TRDRNA2_/TRDRNA2_59033_c0_seq1.p1  ORF type:complete len:638 (-),score=152.65 gnl/TRDRNA2_/TRDRNA2_59033_c0_seq1:103-1941(-)